MKIDESLRRSVRLLLFLVMAFQVHYSSWITPDPLSPMASSWFLPGRSQDFGPPAGLHWATPWGACYARESSGHYWTKEAFDSHVLFALDVVTHADTMIQGGPLPNVVPAVPTR